MSRNDQRRRRALRAAAPIAGLIAAGLLVWQGSSAAFSATSTNGPDSWATGSLVLTNNGGNGATYAVDTAGLFSAAGTEGNLNQGATGTKCLTVSNDGSINGNVDLAANIAGTLASNLNLTVTAIATTVDVSANCTAFPTGTATTVFATGVSTNLTSANSTDVPLAGGAKVAYRFVWTVGAAAPQASTASGTFTFTIQ